MYNRQEILKFFNTQKRSYAVNPLLVSNLKAWYDVGQPTVTTGGQADPTVSQLNDLSGLNNHLTQATAGSRPSLKFGVNSGNIFTPYINFTAGKTLGLASFVVSQPYVIYLVARQNAITHGANLVQFNGANNGIAQQVVTNATNSAVFNSLCPVAEVRYAFQQQQGTYRNDFALFKFVVNDLLTYVSVNDTMMGPHAAGISPGTSGTTLLTLGSASASFDVVEMLIYSGTLSQNDDRYLSDGLMAKYGFRQIPHVSFMGDSITANTTGMDHYTAYIAQEKGLAWTDHGVSGTAVMNAGGYQTTNLIWQIQKALAFAPYGYYSFFYGTNDNSLTTTDANWITEYANCIQQLILRGVPPNMIIVMSPPWTSSRSATFDVSVPLIQNMAQSLKAQYVDYYTWSKNNGGDALTSDGTHPNTAGQRGIADLAKPCYTLY